MSPLKQRFIRRVAAQAEAVLTVSLPLQHAMQECGLTAKRWGTIDNVVDEFFFKPSKYRDLEISRSRKTILHVSCFDEKAKNVKGLLRAAKMLSEKRQDWQLVLVGTGVDYTEVRTFADSLQIPNGLLEWTGELTPRQVADRMLEADAFVLSSRYETYGVVLAEAAAAGLPILSTPVGIAEETGALIVPQEIAQHKPGTFAEFMESILWNEQITNHKSQITNRFTADAIGRKLVSLYDSCLHRDI
jgi:glycosyltransferase involved in cell wall biosynthesis